MGSATEAMGKRAQSEARSHQYWEWLLALDGCSLMPVWVGMVGRAVWCPWTWMSCRQLDCTDASGKIVEHKKVVAKGTCSVKGGMFWVRCGKPMLFSYFCNRKIFVNMGRILAIDYGRKRTGLAVTDPLQLIAGALDTVPTHTLMEFLRTYISANEVETVVVGLPRQMDGSYSESYTYIRPFVARLQKTFPTLNVVMFDERFTSKLAHQAILEGGVKKSRRREDKGLVDRISAAIILQGYLESRH